MTIFQPKHIRIFRDKDNLIQVKPCTGVLEESVTNHLRWIVGCFVEELSEAKSYDAWKKVEGDYKHITVQLGVSIRNLSEFLKEEGLL